MALFGEKYGDVVRMVEVGDGSFSRELCGGTHVRATAEIGVFKVLSETSSAANVRRIEAVTGPTGVELLRAHDRALTEAGRALRVPPEQVPTATEELRARVRELERAAKRGGQSGRGAVDLEGLIGQATEVGEARVLTAEVSGVSPQELLGLGDQVRARLGSAAVVLGSARDGKVDLVSAVAPELVSKGVRADAVVREAAGLVGGGGGGRETLARAGGRDPSKLGDALAAAREAIESALRG
jgi:alanyl-tRNA synthetase